LTPFWVVSVFDWKTWYGIHCVVNVVFVLCNKLSIFLILMKCWFLLFCLNSGLRTLDTTAVLLWLSSKKKRYYGSSKTSASTTNNNQQPPTTNQQPQRRVHDKAAAEWTTVVPGSWWWVDGEWWRVLVIGPTRHTHTQGRKAQGTNKAVTHYTHTHEKREASVGFQCSQKKE